MGRRGKYITSGTSRRAVRARRDELTRRIGADHAYSPTISEGATGATVRWAQYLLVRRTMSDNQIDGIFGPVTRSAWALPVHAAGQVLADLCGVPGPGGS